MKHLSKCTKRFTKLTAAIAVICMLAFSAMPMASASFVSDGYSTAKKPDIELALKEGQGYRLISDLAQISGGKSSLEIVKDETNNHRVFTLNAGTGVDFSGGLKADYIQFEVSNPSNKNLELFYIKLQAPKASNYSMFITAGGAYSYYDFETKVWTDLTIADKATNYNTPCLKIPAKTSGLVRIPMSSIKGAKATEDNYILRDDLTEIFEIYAHIPDADATYTATVDNIAWIQNAVPTGYDPAPTAYNAALETGLGAHLIDDCSSKTGGKCQLAITNGRENGHQQATILSLKDTSGSSRADYLQFEVSNPSNKDLELFYITVYTSASGYQMKLQGDKDYQFYNFATKKWSNLRSDTKATYYPSAYCLRIPAASNGVVRIPISSFAGTSANNDRFVMNAEFITGIDIYAHIADPDHQYTASIDNFCWIGGTPYTSTSTGGGSAAVEGYDAEPSIKLNDGEVAKLITGFEPSDPGTIKSGDGKVQSDVKNNGENAYDVPINDGGASGHRSFTINTKDVSDWSKAKYLQFYIDNTVPTMSAGNPTMPLEIFFFKLGVGGNSVMLNKGAEGIKLYNITTGKWTSAEISGATLYGGNPCLKIDSGFKGYVRIPLKDMNFDGKLSEKIAGIEWIDMYLSVPGIPGLNEMYFDDFYLVSYPGTDAPAYQDGTPAGGDGDGDEGGTESKIFTLTGIVTDENNKVIKNAKIILNGSDEFFTSFRGEYQFDNVETGYKDLSVVLDGGIDLGFVAFNVSVGDETKLDDADIIISRDAEGVTVNLGVDSNGLFIKDVSEGALAGIEQGSGGDYGDDDYTAGDNTIKTPIGTITLPQTGDKVNIAVAVIMIAVSLSVVYLRGKKTAGKHC